MRSIIFYLFLSLPFFIYGEFTSMHNQEEIQKMVNFLTSPTDQVGGGYIGTAGDLNQRFLPLSYYSTANYWGKSICEDLGNDCRVTDVFNPDDYSVSPLQSPGKDLQYERINVYNGTDIYDASTWQIALAIASKEGLQSARKEETLLDLIENQNRLLFYGHDGQHQTTPLPYGINRATTRSDGTFTYNGQTITQPENAYYFRMVSKQWLATDPLMNTPYEKYIQAEDLPRENPLYQKGKVSWADWKPITGENGWAFLIGPLQSDYIKNVMIEGKSFVPFSSLSMQNAMNILPAFQALQSKLGGVYYATSGSLGNVGEESVNPYEISVENNASLLAGLWIFQDLLKLSLENEKELSVSDQNAIRNAISKIDGMIHGGKESVGLLSFFKKTAWDQTSGTFLQGGFANDPRAQQEWIPTYSPKAVDVQTWTITVLGQPRIDQWFSFGSAYRAWETTKSWGGFYGPDGTLWGVGYSEQDGNGVDQPFENGIISAEWTAGAINLVRALIVQYQDVVQNDASSQEDKNLAEQYIAQLQQDEKSMSNHLVSLSTDQYTQTAAYQKNRPSEYEKMIPFPKDKLAYLYASKRYFIPFGWFANPIPSTCSTSWAIFLHFHFNPFQLGGEYQVARESR